MGFYNATCSVTKLPIIHKEECVLVVFKNSPDFGTNFTLRDELFNCLVNVMHGRYDDCGGMIDKTLTDRYNHLNNPDEYDGFISFFISSHGWKFGETLEKRRIDYNPLLSFRAIEMTFDLIGKNPKLSLPEIQKLVASKLKFVEESKTIYALDLFMKANLMTLFDTSFHGRYGGQGLNMEDQIQFNKLRSERTLFLQNKAKD